MPPFRNLAGWPRWRRPEALEVLSLATFRRLFLGMASIEMGVHVRGAAISWLAFDLTGSSLWVGLAAGVRVFPSLFLGPFGGIAGDIFSRRLVIVLAGVVLAISTLVVATLVLTGKIAPWHLLALSVVTASAGAFLMPATWASVADLVPPARLTRANGLLSVVNSSGEMVGPAVAGALIAAWGAGAAFGLAGIAYGMAALLLMRLPSERIRRVGVSERSVLADLREGALYVRKTQPLPWLIPLLAITNLIGVAIFPLIPVYASEILDVGPVGFGLLSGSMGVGFLTAALVISVFGNFRSRAVAILIGTIAWDASAVGFAFSRIFPLSMLLLFIMGVAGLIWWNAVITLFQSSATAAMRGRVMSVFVMAEAMFPLGWLYGGALGELVGPQNALLISAAGATPVTLLLFGLSPTLRRL